jgi:hypothetical protein
MMSERDKMLSEEAKSCSTCLEWHKHCKAECCFSIFLDIDPARLKGEGRFIDIPKALTYDDRFYFKLHGVQYSHGMLRFEKKDCLEMFGKVVCLRPCSYLKDMKCTQHEGYRPEICKSFYGKEAKVGCITAKMTPNCLFRFKGEAVDNANA